MIFVNKPFLPDISKYTSMLEYIWKSNQLTNEGPLAKELEINLCNYLGIDQLCLINNCTNGLLMSINDFEPEDEIITTPFSFVATTSTISWSKFKPVFCDIDEKYFFIDVNKIESLITKKTKAVMATHIYGNAGNLDALESICKQNNIRLIFDAAHAFSVKYKNKSILNYGDMSILSFHATKVYHTVEGGAIYCKDKNFDEKMRLKRNFGFDNYKITEIGINSKISEYHAAMGLVVLDEMQRILQNRKGIFEYYNKILKDLVANQKISTINLNPDIDWNYSYYPVLMRDESVVEKTINVLQKNDILCRRYFYPSLSKLYYTNSEYTPVANDVSKRVICLPMYYNLEYQNIDKICKIVESCC